MPPPRPRLAGRRRAAWLRSVAPAAHKVDVDPLRFAFDPRRWLAVWRELDFSEGAFKPDAARSAPGRSTAFGPMARVVKNRTRRTSDADLLAMGTDPKDLPGKPARGRVVPMPAFAAVLDDTPIAGIGNDLCSSWGNAASADPTPAALARLRASMAVN